MSSRAVKKVDRVRVVASDVDCSTNISGQRYAVEKWDSVEIVCRVEYRGYWMPDVACAEDVDGGRAENTSTSTDVTYRRVLAAGDMKTGKAVRCRTRFIQLEWKDESALRTTPHPVMPVYDRVWQTPQPVHVVDNLTGSFTAGDAFASISVV